jgi:integrase/recombinase XerD
MSDTATTQTEPSADQTAADVAPEAASGPLRSNSSLEDAIREFDGYMLGKGFSDNTVKAFRNDLKILKEFMDGSAVIRQISTKHLNEFLEWLQFGRGKPCSAKTLARRITTLKVFFSWLHDSGVLGTDPAEAIVQHSVRTPLPTILHDDEVNRLLRTAQDYLWDRKKPDARPYVLVSLLIQTGIKKSECAKLLIDDFDLSRPSAPQVNIRYEDPRYAHKNRQLDLHPSFVPPLRQYLKQYEPETFLFECTPRNLEYVLDEVGRKAGIKRIQVGFETLRWTSAVRDFRTGMPEEQLRQKMGLTKISWRDTRDKIFRLAGKG